MGFSSQAGQVILRSQTVQGTYNADTGTAGVGIKLRSGSLGPNRDLLIPDPEIGGGRDVVDGYLGAVSWGGDYEFYVRYGAMPTILRAVLGSASSAVTTGVVTDTITPLDTSALPYLSIEETVGGLETYNYTDAVANSLHLEADANGYLMGTLSLIAAKQVAGATKTASGSVLYDNEPMTVGTNISVTYNAVALPAKSFSMDINNNFEDDDYRLGSFYIGDLTPKRREIMSSFRLRHSASAIWRQAVYGVNSLTQPGGITTKQQLVVTLTSYEDIVGGTPATKSSITFTIPNFVLSPFALEQSGDDVLENDVDGQAVRPNPATPIMTTVVKRRGTVATIS
jgi:hypothetical protein